MFRGGDGSSCSIGPVVCHGIADALGCINHGKHVAKMNVVCDKRAFICWVGRYSKLIR